MSEPSPDRKPSLPQPTRRDVLKAGVAGAGALAAHQLPDGEAISTVADLLSSQAPITRRDLFRSIGKALSPRKAEANSNGKTESLAEGQHFAHPAFEKLWHRDGKGDRVWGPYEEGNPPIKRTVAYSEEYDQAPGGIRLVQYFDKSRMEINNPNSDPNSEWFVTNGLLVKELISGQMQVGDARFEPRKAANVIIAGNENANGPTYATFADFLGRVEKRVGEDIIETVTRDGAVSTNEGVRGYGVKNGQYIEDTGHHVATVFEDEWNVYTDGLPLTEGKWVWTTLGEGEKAKDQWIFVQPFQRRTKTFTPQNPEGWKIEEGNVGRHYHQWRYGKTIEDAAKEGVGGRLERYEGNGWEFNISEKSLLALRPTDIQKLNKIPSVIPGKPKMRLYMISQEEAQAGFMGIDHSKYITYDDTDPNTNQPVHAGKMYLDMDEDGKLLRTGFAIIYYYSPDPINQIGMQWTKVSVISIMQEASFDGFENIDASNKVAELLHEGTKLEWN